MNIILNDPSSVLLIIAIIISLLALIQSLSIRRSSIFTELAQQANIINDAISRNNIRGPYAFLLSKKFDKESNKLEALGTVFFHHIKMLHMMYRNRRYLGRKVESAYKDWIILIFKPWIESEDELIEIWNITRKSRDLLGKDFIKWLAPQLGIKEKISKKL